MASSASEVNPLIEDGRRIGSSSTLDVDVCVVGAGPAGLAFAAELENVSVRLAVVESGSDQPDESTDALSHTLADERTDRYPNPRYLRARAVGGSSHLWCVDIDGATHFRIGKPEDADFRPRHYVPHSGWPLTSDDFNRYCGRALGYSGLELADFDPTRWTEEGRVSILPQDSRLEDRMFLFGRASTFLDDLQHRIARSANTRLLTNSTCVELETTAGGDSVARLRMRSLDGNEYYISARFVILAQGGFEVPRLLLASKSAGHAGLGNQHDLVGRYLTDHQLVKAGRLHLAKPAARHTLGFYDIRTRDGKSAIGALTLSESTLQSEGLLGSTMFLVPRPPLSPKVLLQRLSGRETTVRSPGLDAAMAIRESIRTRSLPPELPSQLTNIVRNADDLAYHLVRYRQFAKPRYSIDRGGWSTAARRKAFGTFDVVMLCEQASNRNNRITLSSDTDALGLPVARVSFTWGDLDQSSVIRTQEIVRDELYRAGTGRLTLLERDGEPIARQLSAHHPAGTTRMAQRASEGVVDGDCRVFGVDNLFIVSSSVFPTSTGTTPTLSIVALAIRAADRIKELLDTAYSAPSALGRSRTS